METRADQDLVTRLRNLLVPIVSGQCEILATAMSTQQDIRPVCLQTWYVKAFRELQAIIGFIGRLG